MAGGMSKFTGLEQVVADVVVERSPQFECHGYILKAAEVVVSPLQGRIPGFLFENNEAKRILRIDFLPARSDLNGVFTATLYRESGQGSMSILSFFRKRGHEGAGRFVYREPADLRKVTSEFLSLLLREFDLSLRDYVVGRAFEETPVDWQGYK